VSVTLSPLTAPVIVADPALHGPVCDPDAVTE
jgi:hypothetical protein